MMELKSVSLELSGVIFHHGNGGRVGSGSIGASSDLNQSSRTISPKTMRCTEVRWNGGAEETEQ